MDTSKRAHFELPVGYYTFHPKQLFNFQLNRWHSLSYLPYDAMVVAGRRVSDFATWKRELRALAGYALDRAELAQAAFYYRAAEFYTIPAHEREVLYEQFWTTSKRTTSRSLACPRVAGSASALPRSRSGFSASSQILTSRDDHFIPYKLHDKQLALLSNARSLTDRVFTKAESAQNYCQIGNVGLALETISAWIQSAAQAGS